VESPGVAISVKAPYISGMTKRGSSSPSHQSPDHRGRGRPPSGRTVRLGTIRVLPEVAHALEADRQPGESLADQVERLVDVVLRDGNGEKA